MTGELAGTTADVEHRAGLIDDKRGKNVERFGRVGRPQMVRPYDAWIGELCGILRTKTEGLGAHGQLLSRGDDALNPDSWRAIRKERATDPVFDQILRRKAKLVKTDR